MSSDGFSLQSGKVEKYTSFFDEQAGNGIFVSPSYGPLKTADMISNIARFVDEEPSGFYSLIIGTDSQTRKVDSGSEVDFVTAVIIYRKGKGARYFWKKNKRLFGSRESKKSSSSFLRDKIYTETLISLDVAKMIVPEIRKRVSPKKYDLEIHIDVGPLGPTREMIREVVGMVNGNGFVAKTKPESWGASSVADKHT